MKIFSRNVTILPWTIRHLSRLRWFILSGQRVVMPLVGDECSTHWSKRSSKLMVTMPNVIDYWAKEWILPRWPVTNMCHCNNMRTLYSISAIHTCDLLLSFCVTLFVMKICILKEIYLKKLKVWNCIKIMNCNCMSLYLFFQYCLLCWTSSTLNLLVFSFFIF